jgi:hypothetical protein
MARGGAGSVGWWASLRSGAQGGVDPGGSTVLERQCGSGGHGGRGDRGGQPSGHLAGWDGVDAVGVARALGSHVRTSASDAEVACTSNGRLTNNGAGGRVWA